MHLPVEGFVYEQLPQRIVFGWGRISELDDELERLGARRVLLITNRSSAERVPSELSPRVVAAITEVRPHVPLNDAQRARRLAHDNAVDLVVAIGGGSSVGLGKAVAVEGPPLVVIPTTYSGSEVTPVLGITSDGRKRTERDERALPHVVIYDPDLTVSLPARVTATSGFNALAHCVEALYADSPAPMSELLAEEAIGILSESLQRAVVEPADRTARTGALYGAYLAGTVLPVTGMAIHHRICHVLGGTFELAHGDANAVLLPHVVAFNHPSTERAVARAADALGAAPAASALWDLAHELRAPTSLRELGFRRTDIRRAAELVAERGHYNPRRVTRDDLVGILEAAFDGARPEGIG